MFLTNMLLRDEFGSVQNLYHAWIDDETRELMQRLVAQESNQRDLMGHVQEGSLAIRPLALKKKKLLSTPAFVPQHPSYSNMWFFDAI